MAMTRATLLLFLWQGFSINSGFVAAKEDDTCFEKSVDYHGKDLRKSLRDSALLCQKWCAENDDCKFWTWEPEGSKRAEKTCYLKTSSEGREQQEDRISGPRICPHDYEHFPKAYVPHENIDKFTGKTVDECKQICDSMDDCLSIEFYADHGMAAKSGWNPGACWAQSSKAKVDYKGNCDVYVKQATTTTTQDDTCFEKSVDYHGKDLRKSLRDSALLCQKWCAENDDCKFWTWEPEGSKRAEKTCYLKTSSEGREQQEDRISGPRICPHDYEHFPKAYVHHKNIDKFTGKTVDECKQICDSMDDCLSFEFYADHGMAAESGWNPGACWPQRSKDKVDYTGNCDVYVKQALGQLGQGAAYDMGVKAPFSSRTSTSSILGACAGVVATAVLMIAVKRRRGEEEQVVLATEDFLEE